MRLVVMHPQLAKLFFRAEETSAAHLVRLNVRMMNTSYQNVMLPTILVENSPARKIRLLNISVSASVNLNFE